MALSPYNQLSNDNVKFLQIQFLSVLGRSMASLSPYLSLTNWSHSPKLLHSFRIPEPDLSEPVTDQLGHVELPHGARGDVPGHVLSHAHPVAELF